MIYFRGLIDILDSLRFILVDDLFKVLDGVFWLRYLKGVPAAFFRSFLTFSSTSILSFYVIS